jgi:signal transduction histidine kinase
VTGGRPAIRAQGSAPPDERLTGEQVGSLIPYGTELRLEAGDYLFDEKSLVDSLYVVMEGEIRISRLVGAEETPVITHGPGDFTGGLAALTGKRSIHRAQATAPSRVLQVDSEAFRRVAVERPEIADVFFLGLARRMRETQRAFRQLEKLAALGKLSAGLAHELNNPAAAARRTAEELHGATLKAQLLALEHDERFSTEGRAALAALQREVTEGGAVLDPLARSDREEELADWLEERGFEDAWDLAPILAAADLDTARLQRLAGELGGADRAGLSGGLEWLGATLELTGLADEVGRSVGRISELVRAMKEYTYMDRAAYVETDVREGLENTLTILGHKLKGAAVQREYEGDLPKLWANAGELNQVWTNLIDNAADAVGERGRIRVKAFKDGDRMVVEIVDDGPGIPREIRNRIFEPFFTTKEIGEGTGLGLDIVRRIVAGHGGEITFDPEPGETRFTVRLPIKGRSTEGGRTDGS